MRMSRRMLIAFVLIVMCIVALRNAMTTLGGSIKGIESTSRGGVIEVIDDLERQDKITFASSVWKDEAENRLTEVGYRTASPFVTSGIDGSLIILGLALVALGIAVFPGGGTRRPAHEDVGSPTIP